MILAAVIVAVTPFLASAPTELGSVLDDIERLGRAISATQETIRGLMRETEQAQSRATMAEAEVVSARMRYDAAYAVYRDRVRAVAREPRGSLLVLLGESQSLADLLRATKVLRRVAMHDHQVQAKLDEETASLRHAEAKADADRAALEHVIGRIRETRDSLALQRRARIDAVQRALDSPQERSAMQRELAAAKSNLATMLTRMEPSPSTKFSASRGKLAWPVMGVVKARFGETVDSHLSAARDGIVIGAVVGDPVRAVAKGRVAYAGWMRGYGHMVLVDHGEHYFSLVSQLGHIEVHAGEDVEAGEQLGDVGESGPTGGVGLAFEIRKAGVAADPLAWLKR